MASWVSARSPATSTILIVTGLFGIAGSCATAGKAPNVSNAVAPSVAAAMRNTVRRSVNPVRLTVLHELMLFLLREYVCQGWRPAIFLHASRPSARRCLDGG